MSLTPRIDNIESSIESGTYMPTITNLVSISALLVSPHSFSRIGSIVTVAGRIDFTNTTLGADIGCDLTLPVATANFTNVAQANGTGISVRNSANVRDAGYINSVTGAQTARFIVDNSSIASAITGVMFYHFQYQIQ